MKQILIVASFFSIFFCSAQSDKFYVGAKWSYENSLIRDSSYWESPYARLRDSIYPVEIQDFKYYEGLAKVVYNKQVGFINSNKTIVIPLIYENDNSANKFINSRSIVVKDNKWGVIDTSGSVIIPFLYDGIKRFNDLYLVAINYEWGYLDSIGNTVLPIRKYYFSHITTRDEVFELANKYRQIDSLENSVNISKEKALEIAKKSSYFKNEMPYTKLIQLDYENKEWIIKTKETRGTIYTGRCANGCSIHIYYKIVIDSNNGRIKRKTKRKEKHPLFGD